jgi:drug/metabolite transporter (DMT)-like permease
MILSKKQNLLVILAFLSIYVVWGTTFLAISYGLRGFPPFLLSGFRFFSAGLILLVWLYLRGEKQGPWKAWLHNAVSGILILTVGVGAVTWAEQYISSTEASIVTASEPFWFILMDRRNWRHYFKDKLAVSGLLIGFAGVLVFFTETLSPVAGLDPETSASRSFSFLLLLGGAILWVSGSLYSRRETGTSLFMNVAQQLLAGGAVSLLLASFRGEWGRWQPEAVPSESWLALIYLIVFGSVIAYLAFIWLLSVRPPALVSTHTFVNPIVAVAAGAWIAGETISSLQALGLSVIITGVILTGMGQYTFPKRTRVKFRRTARILTRPARRPGRLRHRPHHPDRYRDKPGEKI